MFRFTRTNGITGGWRNKNNLKMLFLDNRRRSLNERTSKSAVIEFSERVTEASEAPQEPQEDEANTKASVWI